MKHLPPMINPAIEEDKEGFIDSFVKEFVDLFYKKSREESRDVCDSFINPLNVWLE